MIPAGLENLILTNQARFETRAFGLQQYSVLPVQKGEKIVILGYDFQPANVVNDTFNGGRNTSYAGVQRISFFDGSRYNHFLHKMSGSVEYLNDATNNGRRSIKPFHSVDGLYIIYNKDIGVEVSMAPEISIQPSTINLTILNQLFNPNLSGNLDASEYSDGANFGSNFGTNPQLIQAYGTPPAAPPDFVEFNFEDTSGGTILHRYNTTGSNVYTKDEIANAWYLLVKYVTIYNNPKPSR